VSAGDTVNWTNNGNEPHDVSGDGLSSGLLNPGQGYSHTFNSPGTFDYICSIHPFNMKGSVTVLASSGGGGGNQSASGSGSSSATGTGTSTTGPGSESAAGSSPDAAGTSGQLPSTGMPVLPLLGAGVGLVLVGALLRRRAGVS
jgi:LPXTG-motif cell wall-anchored protein